ncbi:OLC1v1038235C2 [Oldenlandia corymbosa var. corymbosa]|uniref:OLC1v1038235C2 n=1 Tax=Oldenlandia corymbosa var. corymbosa TaxID=529605 RepID=A0AAV1CZY6_OLDCO|nr:OLC1v1038235C2 [Oldenlandia corymbosa var. corymbosa]
MEGHSSFRTQPQNPAFGYQKLELEPPSPIINGDFSFASGTDRRYAYYSRQPSFNHHQPAGAELPPHTPISIFNDKIYDYSADGGGGGGGGGLLDDNHFSAVSFVSLVMKSARSGNKQIRKLFVLISLNVAYSSAELFIGLLSGRVGLVSDAFHLTFGCGLLTFSLFAMATSRTKPDRSYTYGYKRLEILAAFTNALFLLFLSFSLAVEALHAFIQDESEHKHYLIVSAVTNLLVNLIGVWFFSNYARINLVYRNAEDMNYHSVCLHVLADSIRSAGLILASWLLALGVKNAEVLCLGLVSVTVFMLVMPLFKATGSILLQMTPPSISPSAFSKSLRQMAALENVSEVSRVRFWELVPGYVVGSVSLKVKKGIDDHPILQYVHNLYNDLGVQDLTVQVD